MRIRGVGIRNHLFYQFHPILEQVHGLWPIEIEGSLPCFKEFGVGKFQIFAEFRIFFAAFGLRQLKERFVKCGGVKFAAVFGDESEGAAEKWGTQEGRDALAAVIAEGVDADFAPGFSVERRDVVDRQDVALGIVAAALDVEDVDACASGLPCGGVCIGKKFWIGGGFYGFRGPNAGELVVAVAGVDAAPAVDDDVGAEFADDADHVFKDGVAPDFFGFLGSFGEAKILGAGEIKFDAVAAGGGEKFLGADEAELRSLFRAEGVLAAFAAG